jgi:hypothetical protein
MNELFKLIWGKITDTYQQQGISGIIRISILFIMSPIYKKESFYLYEYSIIQANHTDLIIKDLDASDLCFKVVDSNQEADNLEAEGFIFRSYPTLFNMGHRDYTHWLNYGAIACCTFRKKELAAINWVILSKQVQEKLTFPLEVDYSNHEFFARGSWTNPKYRNLHVYQYTAKNRDNYLIRRGISKLRTSIGYTNQIGKTLVESMGGHQYGLAEYTRILFWKYWRENKTTVNHQSP